MASSKDRLTTPSARLFASLEQFGDLPAVVDERGEQLSYRELARRADAAVRELATASPRRLLIAMEGANRLEVLLAYIGALRAGHVVLLTGAEGSDPSSFIARQFRPNLYFRSHSGAWRFAAGARDPVELAPDLAVLLSTSGSTGSPKLVRLSHHNLLANARSIGEYLELSPADRALTCLPMQYSYGMSVIHSHLSVGASIALTSESVMEPQFWALFDAVRATNFQGVPHSFQVLAHSDFLTRRHDSLRFFTQAGGRLPAALAQTFGRYAQDAGCRFYVMYGQTEAAPRMAWLPHTQLLTHPDVIGQAIPGGEFWIERDGVRAADGEDGELVYAGPNVMMGYALKREDLRLGQGPAVLRTGDMARRLPSGYFRITGRASRFIKLFGLRVGLDEVEERIRQLGYSGAATGTDESLVVCVESNAPEALARITGLLEKQFGLPAHAFRILCTDELSRTFNGKIDYPTIRKLALTEAAREAQTRPQTPAAEPKPGLMQAAQTLLCGTRVEGSKSFIELGGDSLTYVKFAVCLEQHLGKVPEHWERMPLAQLAALATPTTSQADARRLPTDIVLRACAILMVLVNHATTNQMDGSADLLMVLAGWNFGRFRVPRILDGGASAVFKALLSQVIIPYYLTLLPLVIWLRSLHVPNLMLMYNFTSYEALATVHGPVGYFWFIEDYIYLSAGMTLVLLLPALKQLSRYWPALLPALLLCAFQAIRTTHDISDGGLFTGTSPLMVGWMFVAGWLLFAVRTLRARLLVLALLSPIAVLQQVSHFHAPWRFMLPGLVLLVLLRSVNFTGFAARRLAPAIQLVAVSSLYIYMEQFYVFSALHHQLGTWNLPLQTRLVVGTVAVLGSVGLGIAVQLLIERVRRLRTHARTAHPFHARSIPG